MSPNDPLSNHLRLDAEHAKALARLGIKTVSDLLYHLPTRYEDISAIQPVAGLAKGQDAVVYGTISGLKSRKSWKSRRPIAEAVIEDGTAKMKVIWFNQPYLAKMLRDGAQVKLAGKVSGTAEKPYLANPEIETLDELPIDRHDSLFHRRDESETAEHSDETLYPVYQETKGVTSKWFYHNIQKLFRAGILDTLSDPLPPEMRERYNLPELKTALVWIHAPKKATHTEAARKRFAFEEVFSIQIAKQQERADVRSHEGYQFKTDAAHIRAFTSRFSFAFTGAQERAIDAILSDFQKGTPMSRLLEGDVGSGKTAVAATTAYAVATSRPDKTKDWGNLQVAYMAPTEILARQHFLSFIEFFGHLPIQIGLLTGSGCMKFPSKTKPTEPTAISRAQLLKWVANGEIPILIGTHALIQKSVEWKHLAYVIIDEQHRFGTRQRRALAQKNKDTENGRIPHLLSMTATPIPRTLALTIYGDLDLTLLDEMPKGRKPIKTSIITEPKRKTMYAEIEAELKAGRQAYVICPRIDEPDPEKLTAMIAKSVKEEAARLKKEEFNEWNIAILHSKMTPKEKERVMEEFKDHKIDMLVATSVVEVGVNVPNATVILIEGAERFGLAQLHQLRGRVIRSNHQAYCYAYTDSKSAKTLERLKALTTAKNGFELAEYDLAFRGSGELYGGKQWGLTDLGMEAIKNPRMVAAAREEAQSLIAKDPTLSQHPVIAERVSAISYLLHFE
ncbi:ATP-dependent DNA helicase RecG [Candidatus Kaiserbacteria bacterium]|nr:ATP-dependent DNA helicase RecG [Candidatus Kaiserbacteria bacterium]